MPVSVLASPRRSVPPCLGKWCWMPKDQADILQGGGRQTRDVRVHSKGADRGPKSRQGGLGSGSRRKRGDRGEKSRNKLKKEQQTHQKQKQEGKV